MLHVQGVEEDWICGSSIGAINGALIAGNTKEKRIDALRAMGRAPDTRGAPELLSSKCGAFPELDECSQLTASRCSRSLPATSDATVEPVQWLV